VCLRIKRKLGVGWIGVPEDKQDDIGCGNDIPASIE